MPTVLSFMEDRRDKKNLVGGHGRMVHVTPGCQDTSSFLACVKEAPDFCNSKG